MRRLEIEECDDIEKLRQLCLDQSSKLFRIGEILVDESKMHYTPEVAIQKIREQINERRIGL